MNCLIFSGNLGNDAEMRATKSGTMVCQFSVAMNAGYGQNKTTTWVRCAMFGNRGESLAPYLVKGQQVVVSGEASLNEWVNKDGETKSSLECRVNDVTLVGNKPEEATAPPKRPAKQAAPKPTEMANFDQEIPF